MIDNFKIFAWTSPLKNEYAQSITEAFSQNVKTSKRQPNLRETDDGKEYFIKIFKEFSNSNIFKRFPRNTSPGAAFAKRFIKTMKIH